MTPRNDIGTGPFHWADLVLALGLLTRLPLPVLPQAPAARGARAAWAWPLAGAVTGGLAGAAGALALSLGLTPGVAAALALAVLAMVTGALHEDGLADTVDGFWGGRDRDRRLSIMKDSRIGSYGALALILSVLLRWSALAALFGGGAGLLALMAVGALSRASMAGVMALLPFARPGGLAAGTGHPPILAVLTGGGLALLLALASVGPAALAAALAALVAAAAVGALAWHRIGGQTGDVLGAAQQAAEMAGLVVLAALLR